MHPWQIIIKEVLLKNAFYFYLKKKSIDDHKHFNGSENAVNAYLSGK